MPTSKRDSVETLREKLESGERGGCEADRALLLDFSDELKVKREDYGWPRHEKLLRHNVRMSEHSGAELHRSILEGADEAPDDVFYDAKDVAKTVVAWIHDTYDPEEGSQETNRDYRVAFRLLAKHCTRGEDVPETHAWISTKTTRDYDPEPDEADMVDLADEVKPMIEGARNPRDAAAIAVQFEGGFRGGELYDMTVDQVSDGDHTTKIRVDGKRGEHDVHLIIAIPYLNDWLAEHPGGDDSHLWTKLNTDDRLSYQSFLDMFKEPAARADVQKDVTPTNLRKSNAYWLAKRDKSQAFIEDRQGRSRGSPVISRYVAKFSGETAEKQYAQLHGIDVGDGGEGPTEDVTPVECVRCGEPNPPDRDYCKHCQFALDHEVAQLVESFKLVLDDEIADAESRDRREELLHARQTVDRKPQSVDREKLHDVVSSLESD